LVHELRIETKTKRPFELNISFVTNQDMQAINKKHRRIDAATDILSFPMDNVDDNFPVLTLGDLIISLEKAQEQADERSHSLGEELKHLLVHGLLHLLGHEHKINPDPMKQLELKLLHKTKSFILD